MHFGNLIRVSKCAWKPAQYRNSTTTFSYPPETYKFAQFLYYLSRLSTGLRADPLLPSCCRIIPYNLSLEFTLPSNPFYMCTIQYFLKWLYLKYFLCSSSNSFISSLKTFTLAFFPIRFPSITRSECIGTSQYLEIHILFVQHWQR